MTRTATKRKLLTALTAGLALLAFTERSEAQEILLTGPLAGAPAVRKLRLYREGRFEVSPHASFSLLDEYQRTIMFGLRLNYNFTDWLALGAWGGYGLLQMPTSLSDEIQGVHSQRPVIPPPDGPSTNNRLTAVNLPQGGDMRDQLGSIDWVVAPQVTGIPFRGKIALFESIHIDTDLYFFVGPAFVGVSERVDCGTTQDFSFDCTEEQSFKREASMRIAPTFGLGFAFYVNKWNAIGFEWRALPFSRNTGGFDTAGPDSEFPDNQITGDDATFKFNQFLTVSYNFYFPQDYRISE
jgi:hypothetical protein